MGNTRAHEKAAQVVADDLKALMRRLLVRHPVERASFDEFFASEGLRKSKFSLSMSSEDSASGAVGAGGDDEQTENGAETMAEGAKDFDHDGVPIAHRAAPAAPSRHATNVHERTHSDGTSARALARAARERNREARTRDVSDYRNVEPAVEGPERAADFPLEDPADKVRIPHAASPTDAQQKGMSGDNETRLNRLDEIGEHNPITPDVLDPRAKIPPSRCVWNSLFSSSRYFLVGGYHEDLLLLCTLW
jgi:hypothetical protein